MKKTVILDTIKTKQTFIMENDHSAPLHSDHEIIVSGADNLKWKNIYKRYQYWVLVLDDDRKYNLTNKKPCKNYIFTENEQLILNQVQFEIMWKW